MAPTTPSRLDLAAPGVELTPRLFDVPLDAGAEAECRYPTLGAATALRYGCRCPRCRAQQNQYNETHRATRRLGPLCTHPGCTAIRQKNSRVCADHRPVRIVQKRSTADCEICGREHTWWESTLSQRRPGIQDLYRRTCAECRKDCAKVINYSRLDTEWAMRLIRAEACELCGRAFPKAVHGRLLKVLDHDHACCPVKSCGACARGVLCYTCNRDIAALEGMVRTVGLERITAYLRRVT